MTDFFFIAANQYFAIATAIVLLFAVLELLSLIIGLSVSDLLDQGLSDVMDASAIPGSVSAVIGWCYLNKLPFMIWLIIFLTVFAMTGFSINLIASAFFGHVLSGLLTHPAALLTSIVSVRIVGKQVGHKLAHHESSAVSSSGFSGKVAIITQGSATANNPTEACLTDHYQKKHYLLVMPCNKEDVFSPGDNVVLVEKKASFWTAIKYDI